MDPKVLRSITTNKYDVLDDVSPPTEADNDRQGSLPQRGGHPNVSRDVSLPLDADNDRQGLLPHYGRRLDVQCEVSPPLDAVNDARDFLSARRYRSSRRRRRGDTGEETRRENSHATMQHCACAQCRTLRS